MPIPTKARIIACGILVFEAKSDTVNKAPRKIGIRYCELTSCSAKRSSNGLSLFTRVLNYLNLNNSSSMYRLMKIQELFQCLIFSLFFTFEIIVYQNPVCSVY